MSESIRASSLRICWKQQLSVPFGMLLPRLLSVEGWNIHLIATFTPSGGKRSLWLCQRQSRETAFCKHILKIMLTLCEVLNMSKREGSLFSELFPRLSPLLHVHSPDGLPCGTGAVPSSTSSCLRLLLLLSSPLRFGDHCLASHETRCLLLIIGLLFHILIISLRG